MLCTPQYVSFAQDFLEESPMSWDALVKKTFRKKEEILPMQMAEVSLYKHECLFLSKI